MEPPAGLASLEGLVERHRAAGLDVTSSIHGERRPLPAAVDSGAYRIIQEALTNAARHGNGNARVQVGFGERELESSWRTRLSRTGRLAPRAAATGWSACASAPRCSAAAWKRVDASGRFEVRARLPIPEEHA